MRIGLRTIKTCISIWICAMTLVIIWVIARQIAPNYEGTGWTWMMVNNRIYNPFFAGLATVYSLHQNKKKSLIQAKNRGIASIIGGIYGILIVLLFSVTIDKLLPSSTSNSLWEYAIANDSSTKAIWNYVIKYVLFAVFAIVLIQFTVMIRQPDMTFIAMLTYIAVVISGQSVIYGIVRIASTLWGVVVALLVNFIVLPHYKNKKKLFVVGLDGFTYQDGAKLPGFETYKLNQLISRNAFVVFYTSRTTGSFFRLTDSLENNAPVILMNGAAIYDFHTEKYLYKTYMPIDTKKKLLELLKEFNVNHFENVVKDDILYIHSPVLTNEGEEIYARMRKNAAYTNYVMDNNPIDADTTYIVIVNETSILNEIVAAIKNGPLNELVTTFMYEFKGVIGYHFLKIYSKDIASLNAIDIIKEYYQINDVIALGCKDIDDSLFEKADKSFVCDANLLGNTNKKYQVRYERKIEKQFRLFAKEYYKKN